jgi:DNA-binding HxlR family transcriptional regulator
MDSFRSRVRMGTSESYLQHAERQMAARGQLLARLRAVARSPYRFSDLMEALKTRGFAVPEKEEALPSRDRERWGVVLRKVAADHKDRMYRIGLKLTETGLSDADALARLEADRGRYVERSKSTAERLIDQELEQSPA